MNAEAEYLFESDDCDVSQWGSCIKMDLWSEVWKREFLEIMDRFCVQHLVVHFASQLPKTLAMLGECESLNGLSFKADSESYVLEIPQLTQLDALSVRWKGTNPPPNVDLSSLNLHRFSGNFFSRFCSVTESDDLEVLNAEYSNQCIDQVLDLSRHRRLRELKVSGPVARIVAPSSLIDLTLAVGRNTRLLPHEHPALRRLLVHGVNVFSMGELRRFPALEELTLGFGVRDIKDLDELPVFPHPVDLFVADMGFNRSRFKWLAESSFIFEQGEA